MAKQNKVEVRIANYIKNQWLAKEEEVRLCPRCNNVLLYGQYVCDKCGGYYLEGFTNIKEE